MKTKLFALLAFIMLGSVAIQAQPGWSVNPGEFINQMTVVAVINIDGVEFDNPNGILGAFVGGTCRGVAGPLLPVGAAPTRYQAWITIYSNVAVGETIDFKFYNGNIDFIHDVVETVDFVIDLAVGTPDVPHVLNAIAADDNTVPTVKAGFENIVREIAADQMVVERGSTTQQLWDALEAPKNGAGTIVGTLVILDAGDTPIVPGVDLVDATMKVKTTAQNGDEATYTLAVNSSDATLSGLFTSLGTLVPVFDPATLAYTVELPHGSALPFVTISLNEDHAIPVTTQIGAIPGTAFVEVTAEEGSIIKTYEVAYSYEPSADRSILDEFYNSTDGPNWTNKTNWRSDADLKDWFGLTVSGDRVSELRLKNNKLDGTIPLSFWGLDALTLLVMNPNSLSGSLPNDIGNLTQLKCLGLSGNEFTGPLPAGIGNLGNLREFYGNTNQFSGVLPIEIGQMIKMKYLYLMRNQFEGAVPASINNLINLIQLRLDDNLFTGMPDLSALVNLDKLSVQKNRLDFEDLEPLAALGINTFEYAPQADIGTEETLSAFAGAPFSYTLTTGGTVNSYQWYKDGNPLGGQTSATLSIDPVAEADAGDYTCKVNNSLLPALTLTSLPIHLEVNSDGGDWETATWFTSVLTDKNKIIWEGNPTGLDHVNVFKETTTTGNFVKIGEIDLTGPEPFEFTDLASDPFAHADSYKISLETTGGSETELSTHQRTIHLSMNRGTDPAGMIKNLIWTPYEGLFVYSYEVWVGGNPNLADMHLHDVVPGTVTSLSIAEFDLFYGAVVAIFEEGPGPKAGGSMKSSSNTINLDPLTTKLKLKIFPNPMTEQATIKFDNPDQEAYLLKIIDLTGKTILEHRNINSNQVNIKRSQLPPGIYQIQLIGTEFASGRIMVH